MQEVSHDKAVPERALRLWQWQNLQVEVCDYRSFSVSHQLLVFLAWRSLMDFPGLISGWVFVECCLLPSLRFLEARPESRRILRGMGPSVPCWHWREGNSGIRPWKDLDELGVVVSMLLKPINQGWESVKYCTEGIFRCWMTSATSVHAFIVRRSSCVFSYSVVPQQQTMLWCSFIRKLAYHQRRSSRPLQWQNSAVLPASLVNPTLSAMINQD